MAAARPPLKPPSRVAALRTPPRSTCHLAPPLRALSAMAHPRPCGNAFASGPTISTGGRHGHQRAAAGAGGRGGRHLAIALEERALLDHQARRHERGLHLGAGQQLDALAPLDAAADRAADGDDAALDLRVDLSRLAHDERVLRDDAALELAVDAEGVAEAQLAVELGARVHEAVEVLGGQTLDLDHLRPLSRLGADQARRARVDDNTRL